MHVYTFITCHLSCMFSTHRLLRVCTRLARAWSIMPCLKSLHILSLHATDLDMHVVCLPPRRCPACDNNVWQQLPIAQTACLHNSRLDHHTPQHDSPRCPGAENVAASQHCQLLRKFVVIVASLIASYVASTLQDCGAVSLDSTGKDISSSIIAVDVTPCSTSEVCSACDISFAAAGLCLPGSYLYLYRYCPPLPQP